MEVCTENRAHVAATIINMTEDQIKDYKGVWYIPAGNGIGVYIKCRCAQMVDAGTTIGNGSRVSPGHSHEGTARCTRTGVMETATGMDT
jgi:hypothetical protein